MKDIDAIVDAYLAERDEKPVDEQWLHHVGFRIPHSRDWLELERRIVFGKQQLYLRCAQDRNDCAMLMKGTATRGQVRTLARLLGITPKEATDG